MKPITKFRYKHDKLSRRRTVMVTIPIVVVLALLVLFGNFGDSNYLYAWFISIFIALLALCILSIPRYISVSEDALEIQCVVELTRIEIRDIVSIRKATRSEYNRLFLALGGYGLFGYYGYYFNFKRWEMVKVYASEWNNLIEIENIYEQKFIVSCRESDALIELVMQAKLEQAGTEETPSTEENYFDHSA